MSYIQNQIADNGFTALTSDLLEAHNECPNCHAKAKFAIKTLPSAEWLTVGCDCLEREIKKHVSRGSFTDHDALMVLDFLSLSTKSDPGGYLCDKYPGADDGHPNVSIYDWRLDIACKATLDGYWAHTFKKLKADFNSLTSPKV